VSAPRGHELLDLVEVVQQVESSVIDVELGVIERHGPALGRGDDRLRIDTRSKV
jgi:hypothetical protein